VGNQLAPLSWAVRGDREQVAAMFRDFAEKVVDLEYDSLPWVVRSSEYFVLRWQTRCAIFQCLIVSSVALLMTILVSNFMSNYAEPPPWPPPTWPPLTWPPPTWPPPSMTPTPSPPPPLPPFQLEPVGPFFFFASVAVLFALCHVCTILCKVFSPSYRARWYRCLARALCCKGLGNGPDPADWKRSIIYPSRSTQVLPKFSNSLSSPLSSKKLESKRSLDDDGGGMELNTVASAVQSDDCSTGRDELAAI
jgi:hypothetical protein